MRRRLAASVVLLVGWLVSSAQAGVIRHDVADSEYLALAAEAAYAPVGKLLFSQTSGDYLASGTLISDDWVLTAAHCLDGAGLSSVTFTVGGTTYTGDLSSVTVHAGWNASDLLGGDDIALIRLTEAVVGVAASRLYDGDSGVIGRTGTSVGYGKTGDGESGATASAGTKRAGQNDIDARGGGVYGDGTVQVDFTGVSTSIIFSDFDEPGNPDAGLIGSDTPLDLEYLIAPGDSGGGVFLTDPDDGWTKLTGVHSFGARLQGGEPEAPIGDQDPYFNSSYGEMQGSTYVPDYIDFIEDTTGLTLDATGRLVPEPTSLALLLVGGATIFLRRRRG